MTRSIGFEFMFCCFPIRERANWHWGWGTDKTFCVGPMRFRIEAVTIQR